MYESKIYPSDFSDAPVRGLVGRSERVEIPPSLLRVATRIHALREARFSHFDDDLFGEPAWDILLALYIAQGRGFSMKTTEVCAESKSPQTTALRWLEHLERSGLVVRRQNPHRMNSSLVEITEKAALELNRYLAKASAIFPK